MVIERQPVDDLAHSLALRGEPLAVQASDFQATPQAFRRRILPAVCLAAHRRTHAVAAQLGLENAAAILAASFRVEDQAWLGMVRISAIVDACFRLIVDGETILPWRRWGKRAGSGVTVA
jgi:hypothetical protein